MKDVPRIAHFLPHYPGREGTTSFCRGLTRAINRLHPGRSPIITLRKTLPAPHEDEVLLHYPRPAGRHPFYLPKALLEDLANGRHQLDGVVLHGMYNPLSVALGYHLRKIGMPYLFIPHDPYVPEVRNKSRFKKWVWWHLFEKRLIEGARAVQLLSQSHEAPLRELGCRVPTFVIANGCEAELFESIPTDAKVPGCSDELEILYIGRLDLHHKGLDLLLEGFRRYLQARRTSSPSVKLVLTGNDFNGRLPLERLTGKLGLEEHVRFTGFRSENVMQIISEADAVVLASRFDGFGMCIVEAMLAKRPVFVSSRAGVAEHVEKAGGGWIMDPDSDSIAETFARALAQWQQWEDFGRRNQEYVLGQMTWEMIARETVQAYSERFPQGVTKTD